MRLTSHVTHDASEDEFTEDLREAQRAEEQKRGGGASASANAAVRDTRDALVQRGQQLQVTIHVFHHFVPTYFIFFARNAWAEHRGPLPEAAKCSTGEQ